MADIDLPFAALLILHMLGLMLVAAAFLPLVGMLGKGDEPPRTDRLLTRFGHYGIIVLLLTGPLMVWVRYGSYDGLSHWFWLKIALIVCLAGGVVLSAVSARPMREGSTAAARRVRVGRAIAIVSLLGIVISAVFAFQ